MRNRYHWRGEERESECFTIRHMWCTRMRLLLLDDDVESLYHLILKSPTPYRTEGLKFSTMACLFRMFSS